MTAQASAVPHVFVHHRCRCGVARDGAELPVNDPTLEFEGTQAPRDVATAPPTRSRGPFTSPSARPQEPAPCSRAVSWLRSALPGARHEPTHQRRRHSRRGAQTPAAADAINSWDQPDSMKSVPCASSCALQHRVQRIGATGELGTIAVTERLRETAAEELRLVLDRGETCGVAREGREVVERA